MDFHKKIIMEDPKKVLKTLINIFLRYILPHVYKFWKKKPSQKRYRKKK